MEKSEILEPLHSTLREVLELEKKGKSQQLRYTDDDVIAATLMYSHVLGNRLIHKLTDEKASIGLSRHLADSFGEAIHVTTKQMTGVDINVIYKV